MTAIKSALDAINMAIYLTIGLTVCLFWFPRFDISSALALTAFSLIFIAITLFVARKKLKAEIDWHEYKIEEDRLNQTARENLHK